MVKCCWILPVLLSNYLNIAASFNLASTTGSAKILVSPVITATTVETNPQLPDNITASYFGHALAVDMSSTKKSLFISAPKMTKAQHPDQQLTLFESEASNAQGSIDHCQIDFGLDRNCSSARLHEVDDGDSFGLSMSRGNALIACSPPKVQNCSSVLQIPGYCYESTDSGRSWGSLKGSQEPDCPVYNLDIIFVLDGSSSVKEDNFELVKEWVINVSSIFDIESDNARIGVVQYSYWNPRMSNGIHDQPHIKTEVFLGHFTNQTELAEAIENISYHGFQTATAHALNKTVLDFETSDRYHDKTTRKILLLLTDGEATDWKQLPETAEYVRSLGILPFAIGVADYKLVELRMVANGNLSSDERVFNVSKFEELEVIIKQLQKEILNIGLEGGSFGNASLALQQAEKGFSIHHSEPVYTC